MALNRKQFKNQVLIINLPDTFSLGFNLARFTLLFIACYSSATGKLQIQRWQKGQKRGREFPNSSPWQVFRQAVVWF